MSRILVHVFRIVTAAIPYDQPYSQPDETCKRQSSGHPWSHFLESHRIADLSLDVVRNECRGIDRHGPHLKPLRFKDKGIGHSVLAHAQHGKRRKDVIAFVE